MLFNISKFFLKKILKTISNIEQSINCNKSDYRNLYKEI